LQLATQYHQQQQQQPHCCFLLLQGQPLPAVAAAAAESAPGAGLQPPHQLLAGHSQPVTTHVQRQKKQHTAAKH
jgi:hypothetical protein